MFSHIMVGANDLEKSRQFYDAIMKVLGYSAGVLDHNGRYMYMGSESVLGITKPINGEPATHGNGMTIGFKVSSPELVDAWHAAGVANGGVTCENPPGLRVNGDRKLYLAYLRDPAGNKICATHIVQS
ncbi:VOC family protein [Celerinatantimonas diazotrophica]|uniref:Catechol 2,3-dioxygenase-like lactoylglutathione lyase family enzyme n=1 Tax=Celerinatantimonas diazotrophica TaxID=412034 RepID=A0A4R1KAL8_9GAMM|nr:VOC family protein [Celerinatantimonas diazotrophica]TCK61506.1 catechol 2,3-dioxygenase-like lactoylglutathione lyase family enzyme [Celerinatantimonas diazotrophica]CAG9296970.1 hypothetical protein CEDIAZO_02132 [Celerinatantimonas diazotrophica]